MPRFWTLGIVLIISFSTPVSADRFALTKENLTALTFTLSSPFNVTLKFRMDGTYEYHSSIGLTPSNRFDLTRTGTYQINGGEVELVPTKCAGNTPDSCKDYQDHRYFCRIIEATKSLEHSHFLYCETKNKDKKDYSDILFIAQAALPAGSNRLFNGISVVTTGEAKGKTTSIVKKRANPSIDSKTVTDEICGLGDSVPANQEVTVMARTMKKETIEGRENYWYVVHIGCVDAWIFGEFVKCPQC